MSLNAIAMDTTTTYQGTVSFYSVKYHYGYIDSSIQNGIYFWFNPKQLRNKSTTEKSIIKHIFYKGDEVTFTKGPSRKSEVEFNAFNVEYIKNEIGKQFKVLWKDGKMLEGILRKIFAELYVEDTTTGFLMPVKISRHELDLQNIYYNRIDQLVEYALHKRAPYDVNLRAMVAGGILKRPKKFF